MAWLVCAGVAGLIALAAIARWLWAVSLNGPVLYGEGAVAHAAILARDRLEYTAGASYGGAPPIFTAANYPPLFFHLAGLGDPFVTGRVLSIGCDHQHDGAAPMERRSACHQFLLQRRTAGPRVQRGS